MDFQPMSPDEMQRMMQFLLNQRAKFEADLAKSQERFDGRMEKLDGKIDRVADALLGLTGIVGRLAASQERLEASQQRTDEQLSATDARLNIVIEMFERHLREDHGQRPS